MCDSCCPLFRLGSTPGNNYPHPINTLMRLFTFILLVFVSPTFVSTAILLITVITTAFISTRIANAEPNPIVARLMNEPLSMLDYGLWRTELELKRYFNSINDIYVAARYDWKKDQIAIEVLLSEIPTSLQELKEKERCKSVMDSIKDYYGVDTNNKNTKKTQLKNSLFGKSFIHNGYASTDISQDELFRKLDDITQVYVSIIKHPQTKLNKTNIDHSNFISCESGLISSKIVFQ